MTATEQPPRGADSNLCAAGVAAFVHECVDLVFLAQTQSGAAHHEVADTLIVQLDHFDFVGA
ncbi:hypothetical protein D3C81_2150660 [compost metagenome]